MYKLIFKSVFFLLLGCFFIATSSHATTKYELEMNVNNKTFETALGFSVPLQTNSLNTRFNYIYKEDRYKKGGGELMLGNRFLKDRLGFKLGFNGIYGEIMDLRSDPKISNIGFVFGIDYEIPEGDLPVPVVLATKGSLAPEPMSFKDTENHFEYRANLDINILNNAGITMGYRYFKTDFEDFYKNSYSEQSVFIGYKLTFEVE